MTAYYNEFDQKAAAWLRELIKADLIADGIVDERSIEDVTPDELAEYTQCHFFAGIGGWSLALRLAGWPDDKPVWTGSCPCQPFSAAGKGAGFADERHLWPAFHYLIEQCRPPVVFGEQVASKDGLAWLDLVQADLEGTGYAIGAADLCAAGVGAPHIRQRLWFVAEGVGNTKLYGLSSEQQSGREEEERRLCERERPSATGGLADSAKPGLEIRASETCNRQQSLERPERFCATGRLADSEKCGWQGKHIRGDGESKERVTQDGAPSGQPSPTNGLWRDADWLFCRDGKWRSVEPGTFPLADGIPGRVGLLRGYGNAIVPEVAAEVIRAYIESYGGMK